MKIIQFGLLLQQLLLSTKKPHFYCLVMARFLFYCHYIEASDYTQNIFYKDNKEIIFDYFSVVFLDMKKGDREVEGGGGVSSRFLIY